ncbi:redoxin domain-containing protein [Solimonas soli]|uniref:redoxin domain-containing protein n=1 Tax=Solimonas soli TaxID=413479 RepID=UPI0004B08E7D|nr:redoxin domain-containing protein [Solimonas soli]
MRKFIVIAVFAIVAGVGGAFSYWYFSAPQMEGASDVAPAFSLTTLDGKTVSLQSLHGHWVLLNFWASWCAPCMDEVPHLVAAQSNYAGLGLQIVGAALDEAKAIEPLVRRFGINYPVTADFATAEAAMRAFGNDRGALPFSVLIDPDGFIAERVLGGMSAAQLEGLLKRHLGRS